MVIVSQNRSAPSLSTCSRRSSSTWMGSLTDTARVHSLCWKQVFDNYLRIRSDDTGEVFRPFDEEDYLRFVDGKPRYDGVESFLSSRGISLERGEPSDLPGLTTVCALGNLKDSIFERAVAEDGVTLFESTATFIRAVRSHGLRTALISSSRHAKAILRRDQYHRALRCHR